MKKLHKRKPETILKLDSNVAIQAYYQNKLDIMVNAMNKDYTKQVKEFYSKYQHYLVFDGNNSVDKLTALIESIGNTWQAKFDKMSSILAGKVVKNIKLDEKNKFDKLRKKYPFLLKAGKEELRIANVVQSSLAENVSLIKTIPQEYHNKVLLSVTNTTGVGGNAKQLFDDIMEIGQSTTKRAKFIASDQTMKATTAINRQQSIETGLTKAVWNKSIAGKTHRKSHANADGKIFDIADGCLIDGEYILPRYKINCKCSYSLILPDDLK
jgi:uncharacterized protein with gpF-like domain